jgi:Electron transfer DM13
MKQILNVMRMLIGRRPFINIILKTRMKKIVILLAVCGVLVTACKKNATPTNPLNQTADTSAVVKYTGTFSNGPYGTVSGSAKIYLQNKMLKLALEGVSISNGPALHVYLSKEVQPINFIDLGNLKSTAGNQLYEISNMPDFTQYKYALIHCQQYNHLFGSAELK